MRLSRAQVSRGVYKNSKQQIGQQNKPAGSSLMKMSRGCGIAQCNPQCHLGANPKS